MMNKLIITLSSSIYIYLYFVIVVNIMRAPHSYVGV